jgi:hypothetical protein
MRLCKKLMRSSKLAVEVLARTAREATAPPKLAAHMAASYRQQLRALLTSAERRVFQRLDTPQKIQTFLERLPANFELKGDTTMSPRRLLKARMAHCSEGAILAVAVLTYHGQPAWLLDIQSLPSDQDHVVALFKQRGLWGAISKTNHSILRWRDPIYRSPRELAMSYAHEYALPGGKKSMLAYSRPFSLKRYAPKRWLIAEDDLDWLLETLDESRHEPLAPKRALRARRRSTPIEMRAQNSEVEWPDQRKRTKRRRLPVRRPRLK